jgi:hypothetical protein
MAVYWVLIAIGLLLAAAVGLLAEHVRHEHNGQHCRCPAHSPAAAEPAAELGELAEADPAAEPGAAPTVPSLWPQLYGPRIAQLDGLSHARLLDVVIYVSGFAPEAVDQALDLIRQGR